MGGGSIWLEAARPKTLWAAVAPVLMASAMARRAEVFDGLVFAVILAAALLIQIGTNLANDYFDFRKGTDTEKRIGPTRTMLYQFLVPVVAMVLGVTLFDEALSPRALVGGALVLGGVWIGRTSR